jgi:N-hydroxyarylamine O-acetyltransferase
MLESYLERIGLDGRPRIAEVHRAHATSIPFENLDPHRGAPVSLAPDDLVDKLITQRRGGYCFEQNLLLAAGLRALGAEVDLMLARVRLGGAPGDIRPRSHLVLRVRTDDAELQADVGFGAGTLLDPIPWGPGGPYRQSGWRFRVVEDGPEYVLQTGSGDGWIDQYGFVPEPVPLIDVEVSNWWTSTRPGSPFVTGLIVSIHRPDGSRLALSDWGGLALTDATPAGSSRTPVERSAIPRLLEERFGLEGFALRADGRIVPAASSAGRSPGRSPGYAT